MESASLQNSNGGNSIEIENVFFVLGSQRMTNLSCVSFDSSITRYIFASAKINAIIFLTSPIMFIIVFFGTRQLKFSPVIDPVPTQEQDQVLSLLSGFAVIPPQLFVNL